MGGGSEYQTGRFIGSYVRHVNFFRAQNLIHRQPGYGALYDICAAQPRVYVGVQPFPQLAFPADKTETAQVDALKVETVENGVNDTLLMQHPAENDVFKLRAGQEIAENMADVVQN